MGVGAFFLCWVGVGLRRIGLQLIFARILQLISMRALLLSSFANGEKSVPFLVLKMRANSHWLLKKASVLKILGSPGHSRVIGSENRKNARFEIKRRVAEYGRLIYILHSFFFVSSQDGMESRRQNYPFFSGRREAFPEKSARSKTSEGSVRKKVPIMVIYLSVLFRAFPSMLAGAAPQFKACSFVRWVGRGWRFDWTEYN